MRPSRLAVLLALSTGLSAYVRAQQPRWDAGAVLQVGLRYSSTPRDKVPQAPGAIGVYGEWLNPPHLWFVNLGLELRADQGVLVGPRISTGAAGPWHAYAGGLFGPTHSFYSPGIATYAYGTPVTDNTRYGVTSEGIFGIEHDLAHNCRWRIVELTGASFSGIPNSHPFTIQSGIVLHLR
jgi:hypothetical protein